MITDFEGEFLLCSDNKDDRTENTTSNFTVFVSSKFVYSNTNFEVGLHEIQIPCTWNNLCRDEVVFALTDKMILDVQRFPAGAYYDTHELVHRINKMMAKNEKAPRLEYNERLKRVMMRQGERDGKSDVIIVMSETLAFMLGFTGLFVRGASIALFGCGVSIADCISTGAQFIGVNDIFNQELVLADTAPDLHICIPRLFVSSTLVKHAAHETRHLLRVIPVKKNISFGEIATTTYDKPLFLPLAHLTVDRLDLRITDDRGSDVSFNRGSVFATLCFRRRKDGW